MKPSATTPLARVLLMSAGVFAAGAGAPATVAASSGVDWYCPPPAEYRRAEPDFLIPTELIDGVRPNRIEQASGLLGRAGVVEISREQARELSSLSDPNQILEKLIDARLKKLRFTREHPRTKRTLSDDAWQQLQASEKRIIAGWKKEVHTYRGWQRSLKPYLIKAVSVNDGTGPFFGGMKSDVLFLSFVGMGDKVPPMNRMPVIAYLPTKPRHVYHNVEVMQ